MADIPKFADFVEQARLRRVADWFRNDPRIAIEHTTGKWFDFENNVGGADAVSLICHAMGVCAETALGILRLAEQMPDASVIPNDVGPHARALKIEFPEGGNA